MSIHISSQYFSMPEGCNFQFDGKEFFKLDDEYAVCALGLIRFHERTVVFFNPLFTPIKGGN